MFMDNYYISVSLVKQLLDCKTYCTGTLRQSKKGKNVKVIKENL